MMQSCVQGIMIQLYVISMVSNNTEGKYMDKKKEVKIMHKMYQIKMHYVYNEVDIMR